MKLIISFIVEQIYDFKQGKPISQFYLRKAFVELSLFGFIYYKRREYDKAIKTNIFVFKRTDRDNLHKSAWFG